MADDVGTRDSEKNTQLPFSPYSKQPGIDFSIQLVCKEKALLEGIFVKIKDLKKNISVSTTTGKNGIIKFRYPGFPKGTVTVALTVGSWSTNIDLNEKPVDLPLSSDLCAELNKEVRGIVRGKSNSP